MSSQSKLILVKILHTLIWLFFNFVLFYLLYAVILNSINKWVWIGIGLIIIEGFVLLFFKMKCPLTIVARKYSDSTKENFDIYLPNWLAKYNKQIYTTLFVIILLGVIYRVIKN